jgi:hypothetical protein
MSQGWGIPLAGICKDESQARKERDLWKYIQVYTSFSQPPIGSLNSAAGLYFCGNSPYTGANAALPIPINTATWVVNSAISRGELYGTLTSDYKINNYGSPIYFKAADIIKWEPRAVYPPPARIYASGPALKQSVAWNNIFKKKRSQNYSYYRRSEYEWLDFGTPLVSDDALCSMADWLVVANPADFLWSNVSQPLLITEYFEQCGEFPVRTRINSENFYEFCDPLPIYSDLAGTKQIGSYTGMTCVHTFGRAVCKMPAFGFQPYVAGTLRKMQCQNLFYSMESMVFLVGNNNSISSPMIGRKRSFYYSSGQTPDPFDQFFHILFNGIYYVNTRYGSWNLVNGGTKNIPLNMSNMTSLVTI